MVTRADKLTPLTKRREFYSDFLNDFNINPITGSLARTLNEEAVKQSIKNIVLTYPGERPFQPDLGSNIRRMLFEPIDDFTADSIKNEITLTINNYEPRARLIEVNVTPRDTDQSYYVDVLFSIINSQQVSNLQLILNKVR
jgi:phage baseplate assembly protein W